ncbi:hypothetical protein ACA910_009058 [Epithemia clementina (nom. ined.)]
MSTLFETSSASFRPESLAFQADTDSSPVSDFIHDLQHLYLLFDGQSEFNHDKFYAAYEKVFDEDLKFLTYSFSSSFEDRLIPDKRVELDFDAFYNQVIAYAKHHTRIENFSAHVQQDNSVEYTFHIDQRGHKTALRIKAQTKNGKIIRAERAETSFVAIESFKNLFSLYDVSGLHNRHEAKLAFDAVYDKEVTALTYPAGIDDALLGDHSKRVTFHYDDLFENLTKCIDNVEGPVEIVSIKPLDGGMFEYSVRARYAGRLLTFNSLVSTKDGKITRVEMIKVTETNGADEPKL